LNDDDIAEIDCVRDVLEKENVKEERTIFKNEVAGPIAARDFTSLQGSEAHKRPYLAPESIFHLLIVSYLPSDLVVSLWVCAEIKVGIWGSLMDGFGFDLIAPRTIWPVFRHCR